MRTTASARTCVRDPRNLISDAHKPLKDPVTVSILPRDLPGQPLPCMTDLDESMVHFARFRDKYELISQRHEIPRFEVPRDKVREHYGGVPVAPEGAFTSPEKFNDTCEYLFGMARTIMEKDGYHRSFVFFLNDEGGQIAGIEAEDKTDLLLIWRNIARDVERLRAFAVIHIAEIWMAQFDPEHPEQTATDSPTREEALALSAISYRGKCICWTARVYRTSDGVVLGEAQERSDATPFYLEPIWRVWAKMFGRASAAPIKQNRDLGST